MISSRLPGAGRWANLVAALALMILSLAPARPARAQGDPEAHPVATAPLPSTLLARAAAPDAETRLAAVTELARLGTLPSTSLLVLMLQRDVDRRVRLAAAATLGSSANPDVRPALEAAARYDPDLEVRGTAEAAAAALVPFERRPKFAAGLSALCPGCGYFYLHQNQRAWSYIGVTAALLAGGLVVQQETPVNVAGNHPDGRAMPLYMAAQNVWAYSIYAAYRDARLARGDLGAHYPVAREDLSDLLIAPFNPKVLKSPYVWIGVPAMVGAAVGFTLLVSRYVDDDTAPRRTLGDSGGVRFFGRRYGTGTGFALGESYHLSIMLPVAAGEEALFRGVVQAGLSETSLGLWGGWAVGSAIFGGAHLFNFIAPGQGGFKVAAVAVPYLIVTGSYLGYVFIRKNFSLLTGAAIHFWYDMALSTIDFIADPDGQPFVAKFAIPF